MFGSILCELLGCTLVQVEIQGADGEVLGLRPCGEVLALKPKDTARWGHGIWVGWFGITSSRGSPCGFHVASWASWFQPENDQHSMLHDFFIQFFVWSPFGKSLPTWKSWKSRFEISRPGWRCRDLDSSRFFVGGRFSSWCWGIAVFPNVRHCLPNHLGLHMGVHFSLVTAGSSYLQLGLLYLVSTWNLDSWRFESLTRTCTKLRIRMPICTRGWNVFRRGALFLFFCLKAFSKIWVSQPQPQWCFTWPANPPKSG